MAIVALVLLVGAACADDTALSRAQFEANLVSDEGITPVQASCVGEYVFDGTYDDEAIRRLNSHRLDRLPGTYWAQYVHAMVGCTMHDELVGTDSAESR